MDFLIFYVIIQMKDDLLYVLALYQTANIGTKTTQLLLAHFGSLSKIFEAPFQKLIHVKGFAEKSATDFMKNKTEALKRAEKEIKFIEKNNIDVLFFDDNEYPARLKECHDAPFLLFSKGYYDFNTQKVLSVVGTRHATEYGRKITNQIIEELAALDVCIVSGLALGIDSVAHQSAVKYGLQNIAVLGHGLDIIYPSVNKNLANKIIENGALLTDFFSETIPNKQHFPRRNRIVAGMSDAVLVVESAEKGGALITAEIANSYNKEVFAVPGNIDNTYSVGCNALIKQNKAQLVTNATDIIALLNWDIDAKKSSQHKQAQLFIQLSEDEESIFQLIQTHKKIHIDIILSNINKSISYVSNILLQLELKDLIKPLPGKHYTTV